MTETNNNSKVFLCHSWGDKAQVRDYYHRLRSDGLNPWLDEEDLLPGQIWEPEIRKAVKSSAAVLVFLSRASTTSTGFVHKEIKLALDVADAQPEGTIFIIPARLEACDVPERLGHIQWTDLFSQGGYDKLLRTFRRLGLISTKEDFGLTPASGTGSEASPQPKSKSTSQSSANPRLRTNPKDGLTYVWIPPGRFRMGCSEGDTECYANENPAHDVEITRGFWLCQTPVTQAAYKKVTGKTPSHFKGSGDLPVEQVSWEEARDYCTAIVGRLPSEAEWEYAARGLTTPSPTNNLEFPERLHQWTERSVPAPPGGGVAARYGNLEDIAWYERNSDRKNKGIKERNRPLWRPGVITPRLRRAANL